MNCEPVGEEPLQLVDSRIDLNGEIVIAKEADSRQTQAIDLQWMVMACDPDSVSRETCDELPVGPPPFFPNAISSSMFARGLLRLTQPSDCSPDRSPSSRSAR